MTQLTKFSIVNLSSEVETVGMPSTNSQRIEKPKITSNTEEVSSEIQDSNLIDLLDDENNLDFLGNENDLDDEYEEIVFHDDFDKEYWSGTENNYLEE